jgi:hypothetical protein
MMAAWLVVGTVGACILFEAGWTAIGDQRPFWGREVTYTVFVRGPISSNFTVLAPALVDGGGAPAGVFLGKTVLTGAVTAAQVVETDRGQAFSISGSGEVSFWARGGPPSTATEPSTYIARFPGGNWDLGMAAPDPAGWVPGHPGREGLSIGHAWVSVSGNEPGFEYRVVVSVDYPGSCAYHSMVHDGNDTAGWSDVEVDAQVGCPVT